MRWSMASGFCLVLMLPTLAPSPVSGATASPLFVIERSINANVVHYDAQLAQDGKLDPRNPVIAYWIMLAEDGRREELNWIERTQAYGFSIEPGPQPNSYRMRLEAYRARPITVEQGADGPKAEVLIAGRPAILHRIYIDAVEKLGVPRVRSVALFGRDLQTKGPLSETIVPP